MTKKPTFSLAVSALFAIIVEVSVGNGGAGGGAETIKLVAVE